MHRSSEWIGPRLTAAPFVASCWERWSIWDMLRMRVDRSATGIRIFAIT